MATVLDIKDLKVGFGPAQREKVLIGPFSDTIEKGQLVCLLGLNGSGKTTLLRTMIGRLGALSGSVLLDGIDVLDMPPKEKAKRVAVVSTERNIPALMLVEDIVALGRSPYTGLLGKLNAKDEAAVNDALATIGAAELKGRRVGELSDGEKQKVLLARAIAQDTEVLIMDEPNTFLDLKNRVLIFEIARTLCEQHGKTILLSTHDLQLALELCDRTWVIGQNGRMHVGSREEVIENDIISEVFDDQMIEFDKLNLSFKISKRR